MAFPQFGHIRSGSADFVEVEIGISSPDVILLYGIYNAMINNTLEIVLPIRLNIAVVPIHGNEEDNCVYDEELKELEFNNFSKPPEPIKSSKTNIELIATIVAVIIILIYAANKTILPVLFSN